MAILMRVAFFGALHRMLKGAYNSGTVTVTVTVLFYLTVYFDVQYVDAVVIANSM